jgi:hypothetical protein
MRCPRLRFASGREDDAAAAANQPVQQRVLDALRMSLEAP